MPVGSELIRLFISRLTPAHAEAVSRRLEPVLNDGPEPDPTVEYRTADGRQEPPPTGGIVFYRLESNGDILVILPAIKKVARETGRPVTLVTFKKYLPLLDGIPWLNLVGVENMTREMAKAQFADLGEARDLEPDHTQKSWSLAAFARTGVDIGLYDVLPLEIENRDFEVEAKILARYRRDHFRPLILLNTVGRSSPFAHGDVLREKIGTQYGEDFEIVDLAFVRSPRIIDLLGLYEAACCIITTDTGTLHLAYATKTPTVALVRDKEGPDTWGASEPRSHWIARIPYSLAATQGGIERMYESIDSLFHQRF